VKYSDKKTINDPVRQIRLGPTDATASRGQTVNQNLETPVELMEFEHLGSRVAAQSLYRRGRRCDDQFPTSE
jgi:hypothetical protein